jgi:hypothetical protein
VSRVSMSESSRCKSCERELAMSLSFPGICLGWIVALCWKRRRAR